MIIYFNTDQTTVIFLTDLLINLACVVSQPNFFHSSIGILEREQEQSVVYGSIDFGKTVVTHEKYEELVSCISIVYFEGIY